jgi:hypothetical protein
LIAASARAQFVEKYPPEIRPAGVRDAIVSAANQKMEEIANGRLASVINNPNSQVRMAPAGINEIAAIYNSAASPDVKAYEFLSLINSDIGPNAFGASGTPLNVVVGFSVTYNVARITWAPIVVEGSQCLTQNFDLSNTPFRLSEAAEYRVFRNGRLIAKFLGEVATGRDTVRLPKLRTGFVSIRIGVPLPNNPDLSDVNETPILYDFDPYQGAPGTPLKYEAQAQRRGCVGAGGILSGDLGSFDKVPNIWVDGDGDSRPDFIPFGAWSTLLNATARGRIAYQSGGYYSNVSSMIPLSLEVQRSNPNMEHCKWVQSIRISRMQNVGLLRPSSRTK